MGVAGMALPGLGSSGSPLLDRLESSLVYTRMAERATRLAADRLAGRLMQNTRPLTVY